AIFMLPGGSLGLLLHLLPPLLLTLLGLPQILFVLLIGPGMNHLRFAPSLLEQYPPIGLGLFSRPTRLVGLLKAVAHALRPCIEHAHHWLEQELPQQQEEHDEVDGEPQQAWDIQSEGSGDCFHGSLRSRILRPRP